MQVKKFEAKSIKEALQMVKQELGPEAIIISAKDNKKSFGLAGQGSVEITAAISERALNNKTFAENKLTNGGKERFKNQTASNQKKFISSTVNKYNQKRQNALFTDKNKFDGAKDMPGPAIKKPAPRPATNRRYIEIADEESTENLVWGKRVDDVLDTLTEQGTPYSFDDVAYGQSQEPQNNDESNESASTTRSYTEVANYNSNANFNSHSSNSQDVNSLKSEVSQLRELLAQLSNGGAKKAVTQHPGAEYGLSFELSYQFEKLQSAGVDSRYIVEILEKAEKELSLMEKKKKSLVDAWVARYMMTHTDVVGSLNSNDTKLHLFVGPAGHGKTSTLIKIASQLVIHEKKRVVVLTTDNYKVGATEQLKIFCQILNMPLENVKHSLEFEKILSKYNSYDAILVDYPGMTLKDISEIDQFRALMPHKDIARRTHLVLSATCKDLDGYEVAQRYNVTQFDDITLTKIDEGYNHGFLYNIQRKLQKPLYAFGTGTRIPEDIEVATRERVLDLIYKLSKNNY